MSSYLQGNARTLEQWLRVLALPGRLDSKQAADVLGYPLPAIPILVTAKILKPLGKPKRNSPKHFARVAVLAAADDEDLLSKAEEAFSRHWSVKNSVKEVTAKKAA